MVIVKIVGVNSVGASVDSFVNTVGALVEVVPHKPPTSPFKNTSTTQTKLVIDYANLSGTANGGTPITAYEISWD